MDPPVSGLPTELPGMFGDEILLQFETETRVDTGEWFFRPRIRLFLTHGRLVLFAAGCKPFLWEIPTTRLSGHFYNHFTGEWVLPSSVDFDVPVCRLKIPAPVFLRASEILSTSNNQPL